MTSSLPKSMISQFTSPRHLPPLSNGDRLTRAEFERRYNAMPEVRKAELIEGVVYMASPLRFKPHAEPHGNLIGWLWTYKIATPQVGNCWESTQKIASVTYFFREAAQESNFSRLPV